MIKIIPMPASIPLITAVGIKLTILPAFKRPNSICSIPANNKAETNISNEPRDATEARIVAVSPAAGPLTLSVEPLNKVTTNPPIIPDNIPANKGALQAKAIPKQSGSATKKLQYLL